MSGELQVREAGADEVTALTRLAEAAVPLDIVAAGGHVESDRVARELSGDRVFVAESDGRRAGYAAVSEWDQVLVIDQLVVAATDQGRHVGHTLLDWIEGYGISRGLHSVRVPAVGADARARDFYLRRGYLAGPDALERELPHT